MGQVTIYSQFNMRKPFFVSTDQDDMREQLAADRIRYEQWPIKHDPSRCIEDEDQVFALYEDDIARVKAELGVENVEIVGTCEATRNGISMRDRSLSEHKHTEDEVRWFLSGRALIYIHANERIHIVECNAGDFIVVPAGSPHWFDMGPTPRYACLRWYQSRDGTKKHFTGSYMAESTPRWESILGVSNTTVGEVV